MSDLPPDVVELLRQRGLVVHNKGGRPPKIARDVAVFLAGHWRRNQLGETAAKAAEWIIEEWKDDGIRLEEHVRTRVRAAKKALPKQMALYSFDSGLTAAIEAPTMKHVMLPAAGADGWLWAPEMTEAVQIVATASPAPEPPRMSELSAAIRGLSR